MPSKIPVQTPDLVNDLVKHRLQCNSPDWPCHKCALGHAAWHMRRSKDWLGRAQALGASKVELVEMLAALMLEESK